MAETIDQLIRRIAQEEGVDPNLAIAIARQESGLNPKAYNGNGESSVGLFQLNQNGGMGSGHARATLEDPEFNARIALKALARTQAQNPTLDPGSLAAASQRPADAKGYARSVNAMLGGGRGLPHTGSPFSPQGVSAMSGGAKSNTIATLEKQVETARAAFEELDARKKRAALNTNPEMLTPEAIAEDAEWRTGLTQPRKDKAGVVDESAAGKPSPLKKAWDDAQAALQTAERLLSDALDDAAVIDAKASGGELRTGKDGKTYWVVGGKAQEVEGMGDADDDGQVINLGQAGGVILVKKDGTVKELVKGQGEKASFQTVTDPQTGAVWTYNPATGKTITQLFEGKPGTYTDPKTGRRIVENPTTGLPDETLGVYDPRNPDQQQLDLLTASIALGRAQQTQAALDAALALPPGSIERRQALQNVTMEAARYSDPQVILREAELEATKLRDAENARSNQARELETSQQNTLTGALTLGRDIGTRQKNLADAQTNFEQYGVATPGRLANLSAMGKEPPLQAEAIAMLLQRMGVDPNSPRGQGALNAMQMADAQEGTDTSQTTVPQPAAQVQPQGQVASVFGGQPQTQAYDLAGIGNPGYAVNLSVQNGEATDMGGAYDIQEPGNGMAEGPPPADIASVIEQLGFKRKQLQNA